MMKKYMLFSMLLGSCILAGAEKLELIGGDKASRKAYFAQPIRIWGYKGFMTDPAERFTMITLSNTATSYVFSLSGKVNAAGKLTAKLGMLKPSRANWFSGGFFNFDINRVTPANCTVEIAELAENSFTLRYTGKGVTASLKIILPDNDDKLLLEFKPETIPAGSEDYRVEFLNYPSSLAGGYNAGKKLRKREGMTNKRTLPVINNYTAFQPGEAWVLFYDNWFDPANNRGEGGCALLFNPRKSIRSEVLISNYSCQARFWYRKNTPCHFILWDFKGWSNKAAKDYMKGLKYSF